MDSEWQKALSPIYSFKPKPELIGQGTFSQVWTANHRILNRRVAIKVIDTWRPAAEADKTYLIECVKREVEILSRTANHCHSVTMFQHMVLVRYHCLILEYINGGILMDWIPDAGLKEVEAAFLGRQLLCGVSHLHALDILHRDLKLENIMLEQYGTTDMLHTMPAVYPAILFCETASSKQRDIFKTRLVIIDFGLSRPVEKDANRRMTNCGSPEYAPPELFKHNAWSSKSADIWNCGTIFFCMLFGEFPFTLRDKDDGDLGEIKGRGLTEEHEAMFAERKLSTGCREVLRLCLNADQLIRPNAAELLQMSWLVGKPTCNGTIEVSDESVVCELKLKVSKFRVFSAKQILQHVKVDRPYSSTASIFHMLAQDIRMEEFKSAGKENVPPVPANRPTTRARVSPGGSRRPLRDLTNLQAI